MRKLWLVFAQTATVCLAVLFVVSTLRPDLLSPRAPGSIVAIKEPSAASAARESGSYSEAARKAMPAVVNIFTSQEVKEPQHPLQNDPTFRDFFGNPPDNGLQRRVGLGSGVIVSDAGYILTNYHLIRAVDQIEVALADSRKVPARIVGADPETDLAVLKIEVSDAPAITFAQSDRLKVGDVVLAIGNPFGVGQTVTLGIVSGLGRRNLDIATFENFIQTDAAINPGNSGGALVDARGNLVGINTAILSEARETDQYRGAAGIGYAIPVSIARQVMEQIIQKGSVTRGWVGVGVQDVTKELAKALKLERTTGVLISQVERGGPADRAGVKLGDVLVAVNDTPVADSIGMLNLVAALSPGTQARLRLVRERSKVDVTVTVGRRKPQPLKP
ncbi:MAG TPA: trypsin-like peptidase domain-containing protein [Burkholderiales bacterium]|nr:trypsin-like peptidase domain-containing protein [Burkholderiales bacterium]